jgi:hypothetical protein
MPPGRALHQALRVLGDLAQDLQDILLVLLGRFLLLGHPPFLYAFLPFPAAAGQGCHPSVRLDSASKRRLRHT